MLVNGLQEWGESYTTAVVCAWTPTAAANKYHEERMRRAGPQPGGPWGPEKRIWGGGAWSPFSNPPPLEGGSEGRLSFFHVFHADPMTKPLALSQSVPVPVTVPVSLRGRGGSSCGCQPF